MRIVAFFRDSTGPKTGLTPTITIVNVATDVVVVGPVAMTELTNGPGWYWYDFTIYDDSIDYAMTADGGSLLSPYDRYVPGSNDLGQVTNAIDNLNDLSGADVQAAMTSQGYTTTRAPYLDELGPTNIPADVDAILADTTAMDSRLPSDPADQSQVEAAITTAEANIRGGSDTLATLSDQLDLVALETNVVGHVTTALNTYDPPTRAEATSDKNEIITEVNANETKIDAIKAETAAIFADTDAIDSRLPSDPADQSLIEAAISASEAAIRDGSDTLATLSDQLDLVALEANIEGHVTTALDAQGYTTARAVRLDNLDVVLSAVKLSTDIVKALVHDNSVVDNQSWHTHAGADYLKGARIRHYDSKANAQAAGAIGLLYTFTIYAEYSGDRQILYRVVRESS